MHTIIEVSKSEYGFVVKLQEKIVKSVLGGLGTQRGSQSTYYLPLSTIDVPEEEYLGQEYEIKEEDFNIKVKDYTLPNGEVIQTKWLYAK